MKMKRYTPYLIFSLAVLIAGIALFGNNSYRELQQLKESLLEQTEETSALKEKIVGLRKEVNGLQADDRMLEKTARNELALARDNELVFLFPDEPSVNEEAAR